MAKILNNIKYYKIYRYSSEVQSLPTVVVYKLKTNLHTFSSKKDKSLHNHSQISAEPKSNAIKISGCSIWDSLTMFWVPKDACNSTSFTYGTDNSLHRLMQDLSHSYSCPWQPSHNFASLKFSGEGSLHWNFINCFPWVLFRDIDDSLTLLRQLSPWLLHSWGWFITNGLFRPLIIQSLLCSSGPTGLQNQDHLWNKYLHKFYRTRFRPRTIPYNCIFWMTLKNIGRRLWLKDAVSS